MGGILASGGKEREKDTERKRERERERAGEKGERGLDSYERERESRYTSAVSRLEVATVPAAFGPLPTDH